MKLSALNQSTKQKPVFAWFEAERGPNDTRGVRLAFIQPLVADFDERIRNAEEKAAQGDMDAERYVADLQKSKQRYVAGGQTFFTPDLGWWLNEKSFHEGHGNFKGVSKGEIMTKYPTLIILKSRNEAIDAAKKAGLI